MTTNTVFVVDIRLHRDYNLSRTDTQDIRSLAGTWRTDHQWRHVTIPADERADPFVGRLLAGYGAFLALHHPTLKNVRMLFHSAPLDKASIGQVSNIPAWAAIQSYYLGRPIPNPMAMMRRQFLGALKHAHEMGVSVRCNLSERAHRSHESEDI